MIIGIPREVKLLEGRVGLIPAAAAEMVRAGHRVVIEQDAGRLSGYADECYRAAGVEVVPDAATLYGCAEMVIKVKEPQPEELPLLRSDHLLFCFLHLAAEPALLKGLLAVGCTAIGFETVADQGGLPLLAPMSDIAGRVAAQSGAQLLYHTHGGKGLLLGGLPAAERGQVVILGGGVVGSGAARVAAGLGANVTVFDHSRDKLERLRSMGDNVTALYPYNDALAEAVITADLLIGAVLIPGDRAPHLVTAETVRQMEPGSVIIDVAVDQGGCIETTRPTTHAAPTFLWEGVVHYGVTNMPGAVPRSASQALSAALLPYVLRLAEGKGTWQGDPVIEGGVNVRDGVITHPVLRRLFANG